MSTPPSTAKEAKTIRANRKRRINSLLKQAQSLLDSSDGIPHNEFSGLAENLRNQLDLIQTDNDWVIRLKCSEVDKTDMDDTAIEAAEDQIVNGEEKYLNEVIDGQLPTVRELIKIAEERRVKAADSGVKSRDVHPDEEKTASTRTCMAKLKFPVFSGDMRDFKRFKELFKHFSRHLTDTECLYQLVESMERHDEKKKIKACAKLCDAWAILDEAYGDQDRLLELLIGDLERMNSYELSARASGKVDLKAMERFVEALQNFTTQVEGIGMKSDLNGRMLLTQVRRKLPEEHRIQFLQRVEDGKATDSMPGLVKWLHSLLVLLQKAKAPPVSTSQQHSQLQYSPSPNTPSSTFKGRRSVSHSAMSPGGGNPSYYGNKKQPSVRNVPHLSGVVNETAHAILPKCPLHPQNSSHFIKGCHKFRMLPQSEKFNIMNSNGICHRCGHNNCVAGHHPFDHHKCQFFTPCQVPTCGMDTHFASICPRVYGQDGYRHFELKSGNSARKDLNPTAHKYNPQNSSVLAASSESTHAHGDTEISCALPTIMGYLRHESRKTLVRILLDSGSQVSLVREGIIAKSTNYHMQDFRLTRVGGDTISRKLRVVDCTLESLDGSFSRKVRLTEMETPCGDAPVVTNAQIQQYPHLDNITIVEAPDETIDILLGVENGDVLITDERVLSHSANDPIAARCPLGWYIQGGRSTDEFLTNAIVSFTQVSAVSEIEDFLGIERMGLEPKRCKCNVDSQNKIATKSMQQSITRLDDGTYQISLPWVKSPEGLPNNYNYAVKRLQNLEEQFKKKPHEWDVYCRQMQDQVERRVARLVPQAEMDQDIREGKKMWFLPHFGVLKDSKTTPVRVVYDGKARYQGHSLNDYFAKGENLNINLFEVALRFREFEVGVIADVSKMFQAVKVTPEDARFHRYVFRQRPDDPIEVYELTTVTFGDKPSPTAATIALRHVAMENAPDDPEIRRVVEEQFYVDDLTESQRVVNEVSAMKQKLTAILDKGHFVIRHWLSNEKTICDTNSYPTDNATTVLGTKWNLIEDTLQVKEVETVDFIATKRNLLKKTASYYDVFGMLSGVLVRPKIILQKLWSFNVDWDTPIHPESDIYSMIKAVKCDLREVDSIKIERCLIPEKYRGKSPLPRASLHGASDASEDAMGIGIWLRWSEEEDGDAELTFVCARARLTPLKQTSMPRKELQAVLLLSRLMLVVENALRIEISYKKIWTDSMTAISWLRGQSKSFRSYVACRVGEITTDFDPHNDISYVPTGQNIIDLVSRGVNAAGMKEVISGPQFLKKPPASWPETPKNVHVDREDTELKKFHVRNAKVLALKVTKDNPIVDPTKFSSWTRLIMVTARVMSLKDLQKRHWLKQMVPKILEWPSQRRIKEAEIYWIRQAQKDIDFKDIHVGKLHPFLDEDEQVYRVGGRVDRAPLSYDIRHPYLLPRKHHVSLIIAREKHRHALHGGHLKTAVEIRKTYWIIGDIKLSRRIVRECVICRRYRGKPLRQQMANLPAFRVMPFSPPFQTTIVDYLGPVSVKLNRNTVSKGYCAVFVCAVLRAVHLTCVQDLSTSAFLQAFERFASTRGAPALVVSDNATCFRGANNEICELQLHLDRSRLQSETQKYKVEWRFGPPGGPHHQGLVERMVQEVKKSMKHMVKADKLTFVEWETVFSMIAGLLNSRPIAAVSSSPLDEPPITPNHFLIGRGCLPSTQVPCEEYVGNVRKRRELCNKMVDGFWQRWMVNIHKLSPRQKWSKEEENVEIGDIVLVIEDNAVNTKRGSWKMFEIVKTYIGDDNFVRVVDLKCADGNTLKRPITKLVPLMKRAERLDVI